MMHMDITPYVDSLKRDLMAAAEAAGPEARAAAERLPCTNVRSSTSVAKCRHELLELTSV